jgi:ABC-type uncharacterized transport system ATPase subunit
MDTLAVLLYTSSLPRRVRDFHPLERTHGAQTKNTAMLFITHDLGAISKVADRILVMNSGRIVDSGSFEHEKTI